MNKVYKPALYIGTIFMIIGVILGAFGAHALKPSLLTHNLLDSFETAVRYQLFHGIALLFVGILAYFSDHKLIKTVTATFGIGTLFFSGSIYLLIAVRVMKDASIGAGALITPLGGLILILSWILILPIIAKLSK